MQTALTAALQLARTLGPRFHPEVTTLGAVALSRKPGRLSDAEITVYKAMGVAMEDMVAANLTYQRAQRSGGGNVMAW